MPRFLRLPDVIRAVGLKRSSIYSLIAHGKLPRPIKLGRSSVWLESDIHSWITAAARRARRKGAQS